MPQDTDCHILGRKSAKTYTKVMVALGGNVAGVKGDPKSTIQAALNALGDSPLRVEKSSRLYESPCFPAGAGPDYVNAASLLSTDVNPQDVLDILHGIEADFGRLREQRWGQRSLDLDLIAYGDAILPDLAGYQHWRDLPQERQKTDAPDQLILPHPRLHERAFVLIPLAEIAPDWVHPVLGRTVAEMAAALPDAEKSALKPL